MIESKGAKRFRAVSYVLLTFVAALVIIPFLLIIMSSVTDSTELLRNGYSLFPKEFSLAAYEYLWTAKDSILRAYAVTILVTAIGTVLHVTISTLIAYPLSLPNLPGKSFLSFFILLPILFSGGLLPTYLVYTTVFHIKNTIWALLVPNFLFNAMDAILIRTYMRTSVPQELYEAARIDGASELQTFTKVVLPLCKPILATIAIFAGLAYWNDWTNGLYYITDSNWYSIQQLLNRMISNIQYLNQYGTGGAAMDLPTVSVRMAIAVVAMIPVLILFPFMQKYFEKGITLGAVKG